MRRWLALGLALFALVAAGFLWTRDRPVATAAEAPLPVAIASDEEVPEPALIAPVSNVTPADREARRFARYDKDRDDRIDRDEYLAARRKSFAKLDADKDGKLGFEEYAAATAKKFSRADRNGDSALAAEEFETTATKRREPVRCACAG